MATVLIVDDAQEVRLELGRFLESDGYSVRHAENLRSALDTLKGSLKDTLKEAKIDVVLADMTSPCTNGLELMREMQEAAPGVQIILMSDAPTVESISEACRARAADYLTKPIKKKSVQQSIRNAIMMKMSDDERRHMEASREAYRIELEELVEQRTRELASANEKLQETLDALRKTEQKIAQNEQTGSMVQFASGIAHDFNNALMPMLGVTDFLLTNPKQMENRKRIKEALEIVNSAAKDAKDIVRRLREFYKPDECKP